MDTATALLQSVWDATELEPPPPIPSLFSIERVSTWLYQCPSPFLTMFTFIVAHALLALVVLRKKWVNRATPLSPTPTPTPTPTQNSTPTPTPLLKSPEHKIGSGFETPPHLTTPGNATSTSPARFRAPSSDRPSLQKRKNYRTSVLNVDPYTSDLLKSFENLEGYLRKKGAYLAGWQTRYFVIDSAYMKYYKVSTKLNLMNTPLAAIDIRQMQSIVMSSRNNLILEIQLSGKTYQIKASTAEVASEWCVNLNKRRAALIDGIKRNHVQDINLQVSPIKRSANGRRESITLTPKNTINVTEVEYEGIGNMKARFTNIDSATLLRFLRARKMNVEKAREMLESHLEWRSETFPITYSQVEKQAALAKYVLRGRDKDGDLIIYIHGHKMGPHTYNSIEEHMQSVYYLLEVVFAEIMEDPMDKFCIVYNR